MGGEGGGRGEEWGIMVGTGVKRGLDGRVRRRKEVVRGNNDLDGGETMVEGEGSGADGDVS